MLPMDELKAWSETRREGLRQLAQRALTGQEEMIGLNLDAIQEFVKNSGMQLEQAWSELAHAEPAGVWPQLFASNLAAGTAINLSALQIASRLQQALTDHAREQMDAAQAGLLEEVGRYVRSVKTESQGRKVRQAA